MAWSTKVLTIGLAATATTGVAVAAVFGSEASPPDLGDPLILPAPDTPTGDVRPGRKVPRVAPTRVVEKPTPSPAKPRVKPSTEGDDDSAPGRRGSDDGVDSGAEKGDAEQQDGESSGGDD